MEQKYNSPKEKQPQFQGLRGLHQHSLEGRAPIPASQIEMGNVCKEIERCSQPYSHNVEKHCEYAMLEIMLNCLPVDWIVPQNWSRPCFWAVLENLSGPGELCRWPAGKGTFPAPSMSWMAQSLENGISRLENLVLSWPQVSQYFQVRVVGLHRHPPEVQALIIEIQRYCHDGRCLLRDRVVM